MTNIKKFSVIHEPTGGQLTVEIDFSFKAKLGEKELTINDFIKSMVEFWTDSEDRLSFNKESYLRTFLKQLCQKSLELANQYNKNTNGVIRLFEEEEGYCLMDGSAGIKIIEVSQMELDIQNDYEIKVAKSLAYNSPSNN